MPDWLVLLSFGDSRNMSIHVFVAMLQVCCGTDVPHFLGKWEDIHYSRRCV